MGFAAHYLERHSDNRTLIDVQPQRNLNLIVIIPSYDEDNLLLTLESLYSCALPEHPVEIIVLINYG